MNSMLDGMNSMLERLVAIETALTEAGFGYALAEAQRRIKAESDRAAGAALRERGHG